MKAHRWTLRLSIALLGVGILLAPSAADEITVVDGYLRFGSWEELSETAKLLSLDPERTPEAWEKQYEGFQSMRKLYDLQKQTPPIDDEVLLSMLDGDGFVEVAGQLYQFDFKQQTVWVFGDGSVRHLIDKYPMQIETVESQSPRAAITLTCRASRFNALVYKSATSKVTASSSTTISNSGQFTYRIFDGFGGFADFGPFTVGPKVKTGTRNVLTLAYCVGTVCPNRAFVDIYSFGSGGGAACSDYLP